MRTIRFVYLEDVRDLDPLARQAARDGCRPVARSGLPGARAGCRSRPRWCCSPPDPRARRKASCTAIARCWPTARSCASVVDFNPSDKVFNALPMFHAFGMIATLLPLMYGVRIVPVSVAAALPDRARDGLRGAIDHHVRHGYVPERLCAQGQPAGLPVAALYFCRRGEGSAGNPRRLHGAFQEADFRGIWGHRDRPGAGTEYLRPMPGRVRSAACCRGSRPGWIACPASRKAGGFGCAART